VTRAAAGRPQQARRGPSLLRSHSGESGRVVPCFPRFPGLSLTTGRCSSGNESGATSPSPGNVSWWSWRQSARHFSLRPAKAACAASPSGVVLVVHFRGLRTRTRDAPFSRREARVFSFRRRLLSARSSIGCEPAGLSAQGPSSSRIRATSSGASSAAKWPVSRRTRSRAPGTDSMLAWRSEGRDQSSSP
jgi:hypothetical protein